MSDRNIFAAVLEKVRAANEALIADGALPAGIDQSRIVVEPPRETQHGDMATNAAMVLAKEARSKPRELAEAIAARLRKEDLIASVEVAGPGFINLSLKPMAWVGALRALIERGAEYGRSDLGHGAPVNVEYVSANPTGPMHIGHCRGAVFGDALANLLAFAGYAVTREYYVNDAGAQVDVLARSAFLRYREALGEDIGAIPEGLYPGEYLKQCGAQLASDYGGSLRAKPETEWLPLVRERAVAMMMAEIRNDLTALNVVHDVFYSEHSLIQAEKAALVSSGDQERSRRSVDLVARTIETLRSQGYVYEGRLPPPKGSGGEEWEDREQTLFRSTAFGDEVDRPLMKSDGSYTYFASDIAYHKTKIDRGFKQMIDVWGADHGGYVKRMQAAVRAVSGGAAELDVKLIQLVKLLRAGEPIKMSKRAGELVLSRDVVNEVGRDAVRFMMLYRKNDAVLEFDLARVIEQSRDNPVFYVQYGHARGRSVLRNAAEVIPDLPADGPGRARALAGAALERLDDTGELALMRRLALFPRLVEAAAGAHEPHRIAFYLYELASDFHSHWNRGKDAPHLRFIMQNDPQITLARLALVHGVVSVLASGLGLLGVEAPEEMR
jgi:arginyl-tRNA synthetase